MYQEARRDVYAPGGSVYKRLEPLWWRGLGSMKCVARHDRRTVAKIAYTSIQDFRKNTNTLA